jgi:hypothetical protein
VKWPAAALAAVLLLAGCATWGPPLEQRTTQGPTARQFWMLRTMLANDREPTLDERRHFEDQLEIEIQRYLAVHPEAANALHVTSFRFTKQVVTGMAKEQVLILLGPPEGVTENQAEIEALARRYWKQLQGNVTEAWIYPLGWRFYFAGQSLVEITQYLERDQ